MKNIFYFGETIKKYKVPVLNEREIRAAAGILFVPALISFMHVWLAGDFTYIRLYIIAFLIDFVIRLFINPKFAPSMILGKLATNNQKPEYVGAPQKKFAWGIGLILVITMFWLTILNSVLGPFKLLICLICLTFLFFESAFGICIGCKMYNLFKKEKAQLCPGGTCEIHKKEPIQKVGFAQIAIVAVFFILIGFIKNTMTSTETQQSQTYEETTNDCAVPEWAVKLGHEDQYRLHHGCE